MMDIAKFLIYESFQYEYIIVVALLVAGFCIHGGILHKVVVTSEAWPSRKLVFAYKMSYTKEQASKHFYEVMHMLQTYNKIRITYDKNLRKAGLSPLFIYATGIILNETGEPPDEEVALFLVELGYKVQKFPQMSYVLTSTHPRRNTLSVRMALSRVYAKMKSYIQKRSLCAHPQIEIYGGSSILFLAPLHRQDNFYVTEAKAPPKYIFNGGSAHSETHKPEARLLMST